MKDKGKTIVIILIIGAVLVILADIWLSFFFKNNGNDDYKAGSGHGDNLNGNSSSGNAASWLNYANNDYKYQIEYPDNWSLNILSSTFVNIKTPEVQNAWFIIKVWEGQNTSYVDGYKSGINGICGENETSEIAGASAIKFTCTDKTVTTQTNHYVIIEHKGNIFELEYVTSSGENSGLESIFDNMVGSFRFLN